MCATSQTPPSTQQSLKKLQAEIHQCDNSRLQDEEIVKKIFLLDSTYMFEQYPIEGYRILNSIAQKYRIPFSCIKVVGSAHTGYSPINKRGFLFGSSDLDIAIISPSLFQRYSEIVFGLTKGYTNMTGFASQPEATSFQSYLQQGFFRPDLMPNCNDKNEWFRFFNSLTQSHSTVFGNINAGIYFSEVFFVTKQVPTIIGLRRL